MGLGGCLPLSRGLITPALLILSPLGSSCATQNTLGGDYTSLLTLCCLLPWDAAPPRCSCPARSPLPQHFRGQGTCFMWPVLGTMGFAILSQRWVPDMGRLSLSLSFPT